LDLGGILYALGAWVLVPVLIAKLILRASWWTVMVAYGIWLALLAVVALSFLLGGASFDEALGWPAILSMFLTVLAIPGIVLVLKIGSWSLGTRDRR
jgi:hypothetical protein